MAFCEDPALTYLNRLGFNVVRLPRTGLLPLEVLGAEEGRPPEALGQVTAIWRSPISVPAVGAGDAATISGRSTRDIKLGFGLKILEGVLGAMGASVPQVGVAYGRARTVRFEFREPVIKRIDPLDIGTFLAAGELDSANPFVRRYFMDDECRAFIVSDVLLSNSLRVTALDSSQVGTSIDVKAVQGAVGANVDVKATVGAEGDLTYSGKQLLAFGYKAHEITITGREWNVRRLDPSESNALFSNEARKLAPSVLFRGQRDFLGPAAIGS